MSRSPSDQNLLVGVLALRLGFITSEALVAGVRAWTLDKGMPLGQVLCKHGMLTPDTHDLLESLVQRHVAAHAGDLPQGLSTVPPTGDIKDALLLIPDEDLHASLDRILATVPPKPDDCCGLQPAAGALSSSGMRFRVLRPHARGGLGAVYVAQDEELRREVALKEIQEQHADDPDSRARYLLEAEVTGQLEHPGVVTVYGLGIYADGRPFYANDRPAGRVTWGVGAGRAGAGFLEDRFGASLRASF